VLQALALIAAAVSTAALLVVVILTVFVVSLAFKANRKPRTPSARSAGANPGADTDRLAGRAISAPSDNSRSS